MSCVYIGNTIKIRSSINRNYGTCLSPHLLFSFSPYRFDFLLWCLCGACHTPTPQQRRLLLASSSVSSVSKSSRAATLPVPALTPTRSPAPLTWWRWPSLRPSRLTCHLVTAPTAASTAGHTWPTTTSSSQRYSSSTRVHCSSGPPCPSPKPPCSIFTWHSIGLSIQEKDYRALVLQISQ